MDEEYEDSEEYEKNPFPFLVPIVLGIIGVGGYFLYSSYKKKKQAEEIARAQAALPTVQQAPQESDRDYLKRLEELAKKQLDDLTKRL